MLSLHLSTSRLCLGACAALMALSSSAAEMAETDYARKVKAHVSFLSDDLLEGRGSGQRGHQVAALYAAANFLRLGLKPAGDADTYLQHAAFLEATNGIDAGHFETAGTDGKPLVFSVPAEGLVTIAPGETKGTLSATAVFVGYGVQALEFGHDDLAGVDLTGKIVVVLSGAPPWLPSEPRAHFTATKLEVLATTGAVGVVTLRTPRDESRQSWPFVLNGSRFPSMRLLDGQDKVVMGQPELKLRATLNVSASERLVKASSRTFAELVTAAESKQKQSFAFAAPFTLTGEAKTRTTDSMNVLGLLPGSDPTLADSPLVITAHLDHIGIGPALNGDTIYNGTMDNAMGSAIVLTMAEQLAQGPPPRRPILFALLTGEEKGLLGAYRLSQQRPAGVHQYAGNINIDMPLFVRPTRELVGWGGEHSTLGPALASLASQHGFSVKPDPVPDETLFVRSDQYPFIREGVPALFVGTVIGPAEDVFLKQRYHKPSDDLAQPIDWDSAGAFTRLSSELVKTVADAAQAPTWNQGDFFARLKAMPK